jgi:hypothetical protein
VEIDINEKKIASGGSCGGPPFGGCAAGTRWHRRPVGCHIRPPPKGRARPLLGATPHAPALCHISAPPRTLVSKTEQGKHEYFIILGRIFAAQVPLACGFNLGTARGPTPAPRYQHY